MAKLFLSYSRKDDAKAHRLCEWLEREGHEVWRDEDDIGGGASFSAEIEKALNDCDAVIVLWSANSVQSAWVRDEAGFGRDAGKLIPLTIDGIGPPLGFRQYQSLDLSKWKGHGPPPGADRITGAIARIGGAPASVFPKAPARPNVGLHPALAGIAALLAVAVLGLFLWRAYAENRGITIAVMASPTSPDRATAVDYANLAAVDMAAFLPTHFDRATVIAPSDAAAATSGNRMLISVSPHGKGVDATLTLSDTDGRTIIWSKSWSVQDASGTDLRQEVSRFASRAALCLTDAQGGRERLTRPAFDVYVSGCVGMNDSTWSLAQLSATFERVASLAPDFSPGWAYVAMLRSYAAQDSSGPAHASAVSKAREAIATARRLNPGSGMVYLAESALVQDDGVRRLALLDRAVDVEPTNALVQFDRSDALGAMGRMAESVQAAKRAVELDPLSPDTRSQYILALAYAGQFSRARADINDARTKWPNDPAIESARFSFEYRYGDPHVAEQLMPQVLDYSDAQLAPYREFLAARLDPTPTNVEDAINGWKTTIRNGDSDRYLLALGQFHKINEIFALIDGRQTPLAVTPALLFRPEFAPVRADPRFMGVAARAGLARYWRQSGKWPDFCTSEPLKYECKTEAAKFGS